MDKLKGLLAKKIYKTLFHVKSLYKYELYDIDQKNQSKLKEHPPIP